MSQLWKAHCSIWSNYREFIQQWSRTWGNSCSISMRDLSMKLSPSSSLSKINECLIQIPWVSSTSTTYWCHKHHCRCQILLNNTNICSQMRTSWKPWLLIASLTTPKYSSRSRRMSIHLRGSLERHLLCCFRHLSHLWSSSYSTIILVMVSLTLSESYCRPNFSTNWCPSTSRSTAPSNPRRPPAT